MRDLTLNISNHNILLTDLHAFSCGYDEENWFFNQELLYLVNHLLASISINFVLEQRKTEERDFSVLAKQEMERDPMLTPFSAWSLTLIPRSSL